MLNSIWFFFKAYSHSNVIYLIQNTYLVWVLRFEFHFSNKPLHQDMYDVVHSIHIYRCQEFESQFLNKKKKKNKMRKI